MILGQYTNANATCSRFTYLITSSNSFSCSGIVLLLRVQCAKRFVIIQTPHHPHPHPHPHTNATCSRFTYLITSGLNPRRGWNPRPSAAGENFFGFVFSHDHIYHSFSSSWSSSLCICMHLWTRVDYMYTCTYILILSISESLQHTLIQPAKKYLLYQHMRWNFI